MARCPFAVWHPITGPSGPHRGGPFKIVHHTTEGHRAEDAFESFANNRSDPHFTVDATRVIQHVDTAKGARALRNGPGGVETNRDSAIQIELVGFAHLPKDGRALAQVARLCRWIEATHGVPKVWPAGFPRTAKNGRDPGGHNRDAAIWDSEGGHYGHCHVPENDHWDPGYTEQEVEFLMNAVFDDDGNLISSPPVKRAMRRGKSPGLAKSGVARSSSRLIRSTMPDHAELPTGLSAYVRDMPVAFSPAMSGVRRHRAPRRSSAAVGEIAAAVNVGSVLSFVDGVTQQDKSDILYSVQFAQRGASGTYDRFTQTREWYAKYVEILENVGWVIEHFAFSHVDCSEDVFRMDTAALAVISAIATQNQLAMLNASIEALGKLKDGNATIGLFDSHSSAEGSGNFQLGSVQRSANGSLTMAMGAFYFRSVDLRGRFLFFRWGGRDLNFWTAAQRMTFNTELYSRRRSEVALRLDADAQQFISALKLG